MLSTKVTINYEVTVADNNAAVKEVENAMKSNKLKTALITEVATAANVDVSTIGADVQQPPTVVRPNVNSGSSNSGSSSSGSSSSYGGGSGGSSTVNSQPSDSSDDGKYSGIPNASPSDSNNGSRDSGAAITIVVMVVLCFCFGGASAAFYWFKIKRRHFFKPKAMSSEDLEEAKHAQKSIMLTAIKTSQSIKKVITNDVDAIKLFQRAQMKDEKEDHSGCLVDTLAFFEYAKKTGKTAWASTASQNIGIAYNTIGIHDKAAEYHLEHLKLSIAIGDVRGQKEANRNIGLCEQLILGTAPNLVDKDAELIELRKNKASDCRPSLVTMQVESDNNVELAKKERRMSAIRALNAKKLELSKKERRMSAIRALNAKKQAGRKMSGKVWM